MSRSKRKRRVRLQSVLIKMSHSEMRHDGRHEKKRERARETDVLGKVCALKKPINHRHGFLGFKRRRETRKREKSIHLRNGSACGGSQDKNEVEGERPRKTELVVQALAGEEKEHAKKLDIRRWSAE